MLWLLIDEEDVFSDVDAAADMLFLREDDDLIFVMCVLMCALGEQHISSSKKGLLISRDEGELLSFRDGRVGASPGPAPRLLFVLFVLVVLFEEEEIVDDVVIVDPPRVTIDEAPDSRLPTPAALPPPIAIVEFLIFLIPPLLAAPVLVEVDFDAGGPLLVAVLEDLFGGIPMRW